MRPRPRCLYARPRWNAPRRPTSSARPTISRRPSCACSLPSSRSAGSPKWRPHSAWPRPRSRLILLDCLKRPAPAVRLIWSSWLPDFPLRSPSRLDRSFAAWSDQSERGSDRRSNVTHLELMRARALVFGLSPALLRSKDAGRPHVRHCRAEFRPGESSVRAGAVPTQDGECGHGHLNGNLQNRTPGDDDLRPWSVGARRRIARGERLMEFSQNQRTWPTPHPRPSLATAASRLTAKSCWLPRWWRTPRRSRGSLQAARLSRGRIAIDRC